MLTLEIFFWLCLACIAYTYALYPLTMALAARRANRAPRTEKRFAGSVSILIPAYNEESYIVRRIDEFTGLLAANGLDGEIIVISDGSTDHTAALAREHASQSVKVLELQQNVGKAEALAYAREVARGDVIVLADARHWTSI